MMKRRLDLMVKVRERAWRQRREEKRRYMTLYSDRKNSMAKRRKGRGKRTKQSDGGGKEKEKLSTVDEQKKTTATLGEGRKHGAALPLPPLPTYLSLEDDIDAAADDKRKQRGGVAKALIWKRKTAAT